MSPTSFVHHHLVAGELKWPVIERTLSAAMDFQQAIHLDCADDVEAVARAEQLVDGHDIELWQRDRKIASFSHAQN